MSTRAATPALASEISARRFQALSDENRLRILDALRGGERCVCELTEDLDLAQSLLSFHLKKLKEAELVTDRRDGRWSYYSILPGSLDTLHDILVDLREDAREGEGGPDGRRDRDRSGNGGGCCT